MSHGVQRGRAGGRRGAQMGCLDIAHPDIETFITAKRQNGRLRAFNLSCLISDDFLDAVREDGEWALVFPAFPHEREDEVCEIAWRDWPGDEPQSLRDADGQVACRVYRKLPARQLWQCIMRSTYDYSDPGFILIDEVSRMNPLWFCEDIRATNPCGEQPLPPHGACLLGSINLAALVREPFTEQAHLDLDAFRNVVEIFSRMLDNVVEINGLALPEQREEILRKRRHGMGILGHGSALCMLGQAYGSPESVRTTETVCRELALASWRAGLALAREKWPAPVLAEEFAITPRMLQQRPELATDGYQVGDRVPGCVLHARYSRYMQRIAEVDPALVNELAEHGARYTHATSIAPAGTMAAGVGNNASSGIEPTFAHEYTRNMVVPGRRTREAVRMTSYELLAYRTLIDPTVTVETLPVRFHAAHDLPAAAR